MIQIKRAYEDAAKSDGYRVLVDRLWPRGISKEEAHLDAWEKDLAPTSELRKWFNHEPEKFDDFKSKYLEELSNSSPAQELIDKYRLLAKSQVLTLVYGAKNEKFNQAVVLKDLLEK